MDQFPILSTVTFLPLLGAILIFFIQGSPDVVARNSLWAAQWNSLNTYLLSLYQCFAFEPSTSSIEFVEKADWIPAFEFG